MGTSLVIQQVPGGEFQVTRTEPFKTSKPVSVPSPYAWPVEERPKSNLEKFARFVWLHGLASDDEKRELEALWTQAGLGPFPPPENS